MKARCGPGGTSIGNAKIARADSTSAEYPFDSIAWLASAYAVIVEYSIVYLAYKHSLSPIDSTALLAILLKIMCRSNNI